MEALQTHTLDTLPLGTSAWVLRVAGEDAIADRLVDMGFWPGTKVSAVRRALLGDPVAYRLQGYRLALRRSEAARVIVTVAGQ